MTPSTHVNNISHDMNNSHNNTSPQDNTTGRVDIRSYQQMLFESVGKFVVCRFLIGSGNMVTMSGVLKNVGNDYFVLEDPCTQMMTTCDLYSLKFVSVLTDEIFNSLDAYCGYRLYVGSADTLNF